MVMGSEGYFARRKEPKTVESAPPREWPVRTTRWLPWRVSSLSSASKIWLANLKKPE